MTWEIVAEPKGDNPGTDDAKNLSGVVIYLTGNGSRQEVSRVAYIRRHSANPDTKFPKQLAAEIDKARTAVELLNNQLTTRGVMQ